MTLWSATIGVIDDVMILYDDQVLSHRYVQSVAVYKSPAGLTPPGILKSEQLGKVHATFFSGHPIKTNVYL